MTILSFELDLQNEFPRALPVEVRKPNMALIERTLSSNTVEVEPNTYYVTAKLPNGQRLFGQSNISGEHAKIVLKPEQEDEAAGFSFADEFFDLVVNPIRFSVSEAGYLNPVALAFEIRQFVGNVLGPFVQNKGTRRSAPWDKPFNVTGSTSTTILQLLQPGYPPLNVVLPVYDGEKCQVSLRRSKGERIKFEIELAHPEADLLLRYLENGYLQQAATLLKADSLDLRELLANRMLPAAALKGYTLLQLGDLDELSDVFEQTEFQTLGTEWEGNGFPDLTAVRGEMLARLGRHEEAFNAFCKLPEQGIPFFRDGLLYAVGRLKLYIKTKMDSFLDELRGSFAWETLEKFATYSASAQPILTYTGLDITEPEAVSYELESQSKVTEQKERIELRGREYAAQANVEKSNRYGEEFLAILSHELRTPLNDIMGWSRLLESGMLDKESSMHALEAIEKNARAQEKLIDDILDMSRVITGKLQLNLGPVDLVTVVDAALNAVRPALEAKKINIETNIDAGLRIVPGDADRLQQVVWNLLSNAAKFTPVEGKVQIQVSQDAAHVQIQVSDTGPGIDPTLLPHVFERFRRADSSMMTQGGLGLGLAIVRHLVELHGGVVTAENRKDRAGARFTVRLRLPSGEVQPVPESAGNELG